MAEAPASPTPASTSLRALAPATPGITIIGSGRADDFILKPMLEELGYFVALSDADHVFEVLRARAFDVVLIAGELLADRPGAKEPPALVLLDRLRRSGAAPILLGGPVDRFPSAFARGAMGAIVR